MPIELAGLSSKQKDLWDYQAEEPSQRNHEELVFR